MEWRPAQDSAGCASRKTCAFNSKDVARSGGKGEEAVNTSCLDSSINKITVTLISSTQPLRLLSVLAADASFFHSGRPSTTAWAALDLPPGPTGASRTRMYTTSVDTSMYVHLPCTPAPRHARTPVMHLGSLNRAVGRGMRRCGVSRGSGICTGCA